MKILIVSATQFEIENLLVFLEIENASIGLHHSKKCSSVDVLITGVGMVNTAFMMGKHTMNTYDLTLNVGVCGSFDKNATLGDVIHVTKDILSELGAEDGDEFLTYDKLNLDGKHMFTNFLSEKFKLFHQLKSAKGITVNTIHGNETSIENVKKMYQPDVESMEGAAFYNCCDTRFINYTQVRAISNYVEKRDKSKWKMPLAINNLNDFLITFFKENII